MIDDPSPSDTTRVKQAGIGSTIRALLLIGMIAWALRSFVLAPFSIPSGSMLPQLLIGDYLFAAKWPYGYSRHSFPFGTFSYSGRALGGLPERGDIVVFRHPKGEIDLIKRVIGLPGDRVAMSGGTLILNGRPLVREAMSPWAMPLTPNSPCRVSPGATARVIPNVDGRACVYPAYRERLPGGRSYVVIDQVDNPTFDDFGPFTVPAGKVFLMGDNRDDSLDSRFPSELGGVGPVPVDNLIGRASVVFWSTDGSAEWLKPWTWLTAARPERIGKLLNP